MSTLRTAVSIALVVGLGPSTLACRKQAMATPPPKEDPVVRAASVAVEEREMPHSIALTGSLTPNESSEVAANVSGAVMSTTVERGSFVEKGATLARIDARAAAISADEAEAVLEGAKTQLELAKNECDRVDKLFKSGAIAGFEYDRQRGQCQTAQFTSEAASARAKMAQKGLTDSTVRAPFAGMIAERLVSTGEYVQPSTKVARLVAVDPLRLELNVPEAQVALLKTGLPVAFHVAAFPDETFTGVIRYLGPSLRATSRDLLVEAVLPNPQKRLRPGMFATAEVDLGVRKALVVPKAAIRRDGSLNRAFFLVNGRAEERLLKLGEERGDVVAVEQGAHPGDKIISPVTPDVVDGARIN